MNILLECIGESIDSCGKEYRGSNNYHNHNRKVGKIFNESILATN